MRNGSEYPLGASVTLKDLETNLHPILCSLRKSEPVSWLPVVNAWLVTRRDDAISVMRDASTYTVDHPGFSTAQVLGPSMLSLDGAEHLRHRRPFEKPFRRRAVHDRFRDRIDEIVTRLVRNFSAHKSAELRRDFAGPVAAQTMITVLGIKDASAAEVLSLYDTLVAAVERVTAGYPVDAEAARALTALGEVLLPSLQEDPESNVLAAAKGMGDGLTEKEMISNTAVLLFGGIETTEGMIANTVYHLLTHPPVLRRVYNNLDLLPAVIEESLRLEPAASVVDRYATRDVQLRGAAIREGDLVRVSLAAANRDPDVFPDPDTFNPDRPNLQSHVTWAQGPHVCLGLHLARLETLHALQQLLLCLPGLRLDTNPERRVQATPSGLVFRKPQALHVNWS